jgi:hypothetical protein
VILPQVNHWGLYPRSGMGTVKDLLLRVAFMVKLDLMDASFLPPVGESVSEIVCFK